MEFCNFCKVPIQTIFHRKLLTLVRQLFIHQHFSFNVQIFNLIDIGNSPQCPHVSAMDYGKHFITIYSSKEVCPSLSTVDGLCLSVLLDWPRGTARIFKVTYFAQICFPPLVLQACYAARSFVRPHRKGDLTKENMYSCFCKSD